MSNLIFHFIVGLMIYITFISWFFVLLNKRIYAIKLENLITLLFHTKDTITQKLYGLYRPALLMIRDEVNLQRIMDENAASAQ